MAKGAGKEKYGLKTKHFENVVKYRSMFQMEIHATASCVQLNINSNYLKQEIIIKMSDSQAATKVINKLAWECVRNELGKKK